MTEQTPTTALVQYGDSADVRSLARRIMAMHPAAKTIGDRGALLLAQLGIAIGLNPLPGTGHIHAWVDNGLLCVHIGLEGRMALARRDSAFSQTTRPMSADETELHGLKPGDKGAVCELFRHDHTKLFASLGLPVKPVVGIGICTANEHAPKGRTLYWRATQRAIKDAIRLAYSFSLPGEMLNDINLYENASDTVLDADFSLDEAGQASESPGRAAPVEATPEAEARREQRKRDKAALYGEEEPPPEQAFENKPTPVETPNEHADAAEKTGSPEPEPAHTTAPEAAPAHAPAGGEDDLPRTARAGQKTATVANDCIARWDAFCVSLASRYPHYAGANGKPNKFHIGALAVKFGAGIVTLTNLPALTGKIERYAKDNHG